MVEDQVLPLNCFWVSQGLMVEVFRFILSFFLCFWPSKAIISDILRLPLFRELRDIWRQTVLFWLLFNLTLDMLPSSCTISLEHGLTYIFLAFLPIVLGLNLNRVLTYWYWVVYSFAGMNLYRSKYAYIFYAIFYLQLLYVYIILF